MKENPVGTGETPVAPGVPPRDPCHGIVFRLFGPLLGRCMGFLHSPCDGQGDRLFPQVPVSPLLTGVPLQR